VGVTSFDENEVNYVCQTCFYKWTMPRYKLKTFDPKEVRRQLEEEEQKSKKKRRWFF
jgi:hypothetical protein